MLNTPKSAAAVHISTGEKMYKWEDEMPFDYVRGGGLLAAPEGPTQLCLSWRLLPDGTDVWQTDECAEFALALCQSELQPFICNTGANSTRPVDANPYDAKAKVYCPPGRSSFPCKHVTPY